MTEIVLRPAAAADIEDAFAWYERQRPGLGHDFLDEIESAMNSIGMRPSAYPIIHRSARRMLVRRFPYAIFYRFLDDTVVVVACMHASRDPLVWKSRI